MARTPKYDDTDLLDRAVDVVWRRGWSSTSIRDLEQALDVKAPSIYRRFGSRDGVGVAVIEHYVDRVVRRRVDKYLSGEGDPVANITVFFERSVQQPDTSEALRGCLLTTTSADDLDDAMRDAVLIGVAVIESSLRREVERAAGSGRLRPGVDVDVATATLSAAMQGFMTLARAGMASDELRRRAHAVVSAVTPAGTDIPSTRPTRAEEGS